MQLSSDEDAATFSVQILDIGNCTLVGEQDGWASLLFVHMVSNLKALMTRIFPIQRNQFTDHILLRTCAILALHNVVLDDLTIKLLEQLPGKRRTYNSVDTLLNADEVNFAVEFLNNLKTSSSPTSQFARQDLSTSDFAKSPGSTEILQCHTA